MTCLSDGGYGAPRSHRCECVREAGHPLDSLRSHGCSCGAMWDCPECHDADPTDGCAQCGASAA